MKIKFYAHACFRLEHNGLSLITDPYTPSIAQFEPVGETCDIVVMSSAMDRFHSDALQVPGDPQVVDAMTVSPYGTMVRGIRIQSIPNLMIVKQRTMIFNQPGALPEAALRDLIQQAIKLEIPPHDHDHDHDHNHDHEHHHHDEQAESVEEAAE